MCVSSTIESLRGAQASDLSIADAILGVEDIGDRVIRDYIQAHWGEIPDVLVDVSALPQALPSPSLDWGLALDATGALPLLYVWSASCGSTPVNIWDGTHQSVLGLDGNEEADSLREWIELNSSELIGYANSSEYDVPPQVEVIRKGDIHWFWDDMGAEEIAHGVLGALDLVDVLEMANEAWEGEWIIISTEEEVAERLETALEALLDRREELTDEVLNQETNYHITYSNMIDIMVEQLRYLIAS